MFTTHSDIMELSFFLHDNNNFPISVYYALPQNETVFHQHNFVELILVLSGTGVHSTGKHNAALHRGDICVIPCGIEHRYQQVSEDFSLINILFDPEKLPISGLDAVQLPGFKPMLFGCPTDKKATYLAFHVKEEEFQFLETLALSLVKEHDEHLPGTSFVSLGIFMALIGKLTRLYSQEQRSSTFHYDQISKIIAYINENYHEDITIMNLCKLGSMSKTSLMRNFKNATGISPLQYLLRLRLNEVALLLCSTEKSLGEIAEKVGFNDINYLGRQFKRNLGLPPALYRKRHRGQYCNISTTDLPNLMKN